MRTKTFLLTLLLGFSISSPAWSHPVAYKGSYSIMTWNNPEMTDWMFTHSFTSQQSVSLHYLRNETKEGEREFYLPAVNFLAQRWNELNSQANLYLTVGHGGEKVGTSLKDTSILALETDWESREFYISFKQEALLTHRDSSKNIYTSRLRGGFAPYVASFEEINSWFILQLEKSNKSMSEYTLTPLIRMFYKNVLVETGVSHKGEAQFNFMVHF